MRWSWLRDSFVLFVKRVNVSVFVSCVLGERETWSNCNMSKTGLNRNIVQPCCFWCKLDTERLCEHPLLYILWKL